jgi:hypothetical protein
MYVLYIYVLATSGSGARVGDAHAAHGAHYVWRKTPVCNVNAHVKNKWPRSSRVFQIQVVFQHHAH